MVQEAVPQKLYQRALNRFSIFVTVIFLILLGRLWYLQEIKGPLMEKHSEQNRIGTYRINSPRGMMLDRRGRVLVDNRPAFNLVFNPAVIPRRDQRRFLHAICAEIGCDVELAEARLKKRHGPITLKEDISRDELARVETIGMFYKGTEFPVRVEQVGKRTFKYGPLFAHAIGYTGEISQPQLDQPDYKDYRPGDRVGRSGVEFTYETNLRGEFGRREVEENARGTQIRALSYQAAVPGKNVLLAIDLDLQRAAARAMGDQAGAVVAIDPRDGKVRVLYSAPSFDPDLFTRPLSKDDWDALSNDPRHPLQNKVIGGMYPPGSTFKVVSALAGLQEEEITLKSGFECAGKWKFGEREFRCFNERGHGFVTFFTSIQRSCDIYYYKLSVKLGIERLARYARMLGGGEKTGVDIPGEAAGLIPDPQWKETTYHKAWMPGETLNTSIGQGSVMMTPLQLAVMYAAIANRGTIYKPQLVDKILAPSGKVIETVPPEAVRELPIDKRYFDSLQRALTMVVNTEGGSAYRARLKTILVAGKTGTSQVRRIGKQRKHWSTVPWEQRDHALFACFAPAESPELVVIAVVEHGGFGSIAAAPVAMSVMSEFARLRRLAPDETAPE